MKTTIVIDGEFHGPGLRGRSKEPIDIDSLNLPAEFKEEMRSWQDEYAKLHMSGYSNKSEIDRLDIIGRDLALKLQELLGNPYQVYYYSDAYSRKYVLENGDFREVPIGW